MLKYDLLPKQLIHEGTCVPENFFEPEFPEDEDILRVHNRKYLYRLYHTELDKKEVRRIGFPLSEELVRRERIITQGTIRASQYALKYGIAMNIAGGTHHAYADHGEAFCLLNDQAIGAAYLLHQKLAEQILIIDLDVHQGNGTAKIFQGTSNVYTFSVHGAANYPFRKEISDWDIALPTNTGDKEYLDIVTEALSQLFKNLRPDFVFYLCGVDILETDKLGKLACTIEGCKKRDQMVLQKCKDENVPVMCSMGGGYSPQIRDIVNAHANTFRIAQDLFF